jgi:tetratricopeptide (TPR) repeat protein
LTNDEMGSTLFEAGRQAEALPSFEAAVREEPRSPFLYHLGRCQLALEKVGEAEASLRRALERAQEEGASEADLQKIHYQLGVTLKKRGAAQEAATHLAEARRLEAEPTDGSSGGAAMGPSVAAAAPDDPAAASSDLPWQQRPELSRRVKAGLARAYFNLGVLQAQNQNVTPDAERFARAAGFFVQAAGVDPDFPQVQVSLGVAYFNAGQFDKATGPLARALAASPQDAGLKRMLAMAWLNAQAYEKAADLLRDDSERDVNPSLQLAYGLALVHSGRAAEAEKFLSAIAPRRGDSAELQVLLGQARAELGQYDAAIESLTRALQVKADVRDAHGTLGLVFFRQGHLAEAEKALRTELEGNPADLASRKNLAAVLDSEKKPEEAISLLRGVLKSQPDFADARYLLGKILLAQGAASEAVEHLEAAARLTPDDANVHYQLGQAYEKLGRLSLARQHYDASRRLKAGP